MNRVQGLLRGLSAFVACVALSLPLAFGQHATVTGSVTLEDGSPVAKAVVTAVPTVEGKATRSIKTRKNGEYSLPFVEFGTYRFTAEQEGLLIKSIDVRITDANRQPQKEYSSDVDALQQLPEFRLGQEWSAEVKFVMVPRSYFADVMAVPGDVAATNALNEANDLTMAGKYDESTALLQKLVDEGTATSKAYYLLGSNAYAQHKTDEALRWFEKTLEADPEQPGLYAHLGSIAREQGDTERALAMYDRELELSPQATTVAINRAILLAEMGRTEEAIAAFEHVLELNPDETNAYSEMAILYLDQGRDEEAAAVLERLEQRGEPDPALWFNIGAGFANRNLNEQARDAYRKALAIDPDFADAVRELGYLSINEGDMAGAVGHLEKYLELRPAASDAEDIRALVEALRKQSGESG